MDKIKTMRLRLSILPFSSPNVASAETEKPSVDKEGDPGGGGVKAGEGERGRGRPKESTITPGGGANSELRLLLLLWLNKYVKVNT